MLLKDHTYKVTSEKDIDELVNNQLKDIKEGTEVLLHMPLGRVDYSKLSKFKVGLLNPFPRTKDIPFYGFKDLLKDILGDNKVDVIPFDKECEDALKYEGIDYITKSDGKTPSIVLANEVNQHNFKEFVEKVKEGNSMAFCDKYYTYNYDSSMPTVTTLDEYPHRTYSFTKDNVPEFLKDKIVDEDEVITVVVLNQNQLGSILDKNEENN